MRLDRWELCSFCEGANVDASRKERPTLWRGSSPWSPGNVSAKGGLSPVHRGQVLELVPWTACHSVHGVLPASGLCDPPQRFWCCVGDICVMKGNF